MISKKHSEAARRNGKLYGGKKPRTDSELARDFWANVQKTETCWIWKRCRGKHGYGQFCVRGKITPAHRFSWELHHLRPVSFGKLVCHHCDNPPCVNPSHLFVGSFKDNNQDCIRKGRNHPPPHPHNLTEDQKEFIRKSFVPHKKTVQMLASELGVGFHSVKNVLWPSAKSVHCAKGEEGAVITIERI